MELIKMLLKFIIAKHRESVLKKSHKLAIKPEVSRWKNDVLKHLNIGQRMFYCLRMGNFNMMKLNKKHIAD